AALIPVTITDDVTLSLSKGEPASATMYAMSQPPPVFLGTVPRAEIAAALHLDDADLLEGTTTPQTVSTGTPQLMIATSVHVFARGSGDVALVARHFSDFGDVIEDPFTGSATGGMAAYCARYGIVRERTYAVEQGMHVHRPGRAQVEVGGDPPHAIGRITVAGPPSPCCAAR
ncbi:MAG TPA: PhzF family phenazine biosynthesis protein, partial [Candidatus Elarobacter sp.]